MPNSLIKDFNMKNMFADFTPIELNPNPSKEEIAQYYIENNMSTDNDYLDNFFQLPVFDSKFISSKSEELTRPVPLKRGGDYSRREPVATSPAASSVTTNSAPLSQGIIGKGKYIMNFFLNKGLTREQSSGILGNLQAESGLNTDIWGDNGTSYGLAQWHKSRYTNLFNFAKAKSKPVNDLDTQLEFLWHELQTSHNSAYKNLLATSTPEQAAEVFAKQFEKMKTYSTVREKYALKHYQ